MQHPGWILVPWAVFALALAVKCWRLALLLQRLRQAQPNPASIERFRAALERRWLNDPKWG